MKDKKVFKEKKRIKSLGCLLESTYLVFPNLIDDLIMVDDILHTQ